MKKDSIFYGFVIADFMVRNLKLSGLNLLLYAALLKAYSTDFELIMSGYPEDKGVKIEDEYLTQLLGCDVKKLAHHCSELQEENLIHVFPNRNYSEYKIINYDKYSSFLR